MSMYEEIGLMVFGSWLKKISQQFQQDILKIYESEGIRFELSWYPIFHLLKKQEGIAVTSLSNQLEISHPAVIQVLASLKKEGLIDISKDGKDKRKRHIALSHKGWQLMDKLQPIWVKMEQVIHEFMNDTGITKDIQQVLQALETNFNTKSLVERYKEKE